MQVLAFLGPRSRSHKLPDLCCLVLYLRSRPVCAAKVVNLEQEAGKSFSYDQLKKAVEKHKPAVLFLCQVRTPKPMPSETA